MMMISIYYKRFPLVHTTINIQVTHQHAPRISKVTAFKNRVDHELQRVSVLLCWTMVLRGRMLRSRSVLAYLLGATIYGKGLVHPTEISLLELGV